MLYLPAPMVGAETNLLEQMMNEMDNFGEINQLQTVANIEDITNNNHNINTSTNNNNNNDNNNNLKNETKLDINTLSNINNKQNEETLVHKSKRGRKRKVSF